VLLVTGTVNHRNKKVLKNIYDQMPEPKAVIAIGACGNTGGVFREAYNVVGGVDKVIPVDVYVPGCPAKPEAIIDGVVAGLAKFAQKVEEAK
jgi:ech hydrogenase subunit C